MKPKNPEDAARLADMQFWIIFDVLFEKGLLSYEDIQNSIARFRDMIKPENPDYKLFKARADEMEKVYQPGPRDPQIPWPPKRG